MLFRSAGYFMSAIKNVQRQLNIHQKTLEQLEEQRATLGLYAPPYIVMGIEDTKAAIAELKETLANLERSGEPTLTPATKAAGKQRARIQLQGDFSSVSADTAKAAVNAFAAIMGISPNDVDLLVVASGSIILDLGIPATAMATLRALLRANIAQLRLMNTERATLALQNGSIEERDFLDGQFQITHPSAPPPAPPASPSFLGKVWRLIKFLGLIAVVGGLGIWIGVNLAQPEPLPPPRVIPPTEPPARVTPLRRATNTPIQPGSIELGLPNGCNQKYEAGLDTEISVVANIKGVIFILLNDEEIFAVDAVPDEVVALKWQYPQDEGNYTLRAVMESGEEAECPFFSYAVNTSPPSVSTEPDTNRPGGDYSAFKIPVPTDDVNTSQPDPETCRLACLDDADCQAYTFVKVGYESNTAAICYLKDTIPPPIGDGCCVSGIKNTP